MDNIQQKGKVGSPLLLEILLIVTLVAITLVTLNYFNIVPLSSSLPIFSFLPRLGSGTVSQPSKPVNQLATNPSIPTTQTSKESTTKTIVTSNLPKVFSNNESKYKWTTIENSFVTVLGDIRIDVEIGVKSTLISAQKEASNGMLFTNGLASSDKDHRYIVLFYYLPDQNWVVGHKSGGELKFLPLVTKKETDIFGRFDLLISSDGKTVTVTPSQGKQETIQLVESLYQTTNKMKSVAQVSPGSDITIYSLQYEYQQSQ